MFSERDSQCRGKWNKVGNQSLPTPTGEACYVFMFILTSYLGKLVLASRLLTFKRYTLVGVAIPHGLPSASCLTLLIQDTNLIFHLVLSIYLLNQLEADKIKFFKQH